MRTEPNAFQAKITKASEVDRKTNTVGPEYLLTFCMHCYKTGEYKPFIALWSQGGDVQTCASGFERVENIPCYLCGAIITTHNEPPGRYWVTVETKEPPEKRFLDEYSAHYIGTVGCDERWRHLIMVPDACIPRWEGYLKRDSAVIEWRRID